MNKYQRKIYDECVSIQRQHPQNIPLKEIGDLIEDPQHFDKLQHQILPRKLIINSINSCNANCIFCGYQYKTDKYENISLEMVDTATKQLVALHPDSFVSFTPTVGDPLLDRKIFDKVNLAKHNGIKRVQFYTNGILLKDVISELLKSKLDNLEISIADFDRDVYEKVYRTNKYSLVLDGISALLQELKNNNVPLPVKINIRGPSTISKIKTRKDFKLKIEPYLTNFIFLSDTPVFDNCMGQITQSDLLDNMKIANASSTRMYKPCIRLFDLQLLQNGDLRLCGCRFNKTVYDDLVIGNLSDARLSDIWFSEKAKSLRSNFFNNDLPKACLKCSYYEPMTGKSKRSIFQSSHC